MRMMLGRVRMMLGWLRMSSRVRMSSRAAGRCAGRSRWPGCFISPWQQFRDKTPSGSGLGRGPERRAGTEPPLEEYQHFHIAAACQPLLELKTISIVQFDCLNQTDLQQIHLSFDKSITVSFH